MYLKRNSILNVITREHLTFLATCYVIISNFISLVLRDSDRDSENVSLIRRSVSDGQKTCSSKCVSRIDIKIAFSLRLNPVTYDIVLQSMHLSVS